jgi:hypothetical protein
VRGTGAPAPGDPEILILADVGYGTRLAYVQAELPAILVGRIRADRVLRLPAPTRTPATIGRPRKHGSESPAARSLTYAGPGNARIRPNGSPRPASGAGFGTYAPEPALPPRRRNPPGQEQDARPDDATRTPPAATTSTLSSAPDPATRKQNKEIDQPKTTPYGSKAKLDQVRLLFSLPEAEKLQLAF